ncbi:Uncharacterised protein [Acinetobacter baumannii]|nr:Uncharacterised protein [Acinetobacter baumannii]
MACFGKTVFRSALCSDLLQPVMNNRLSVVLKNSFNFIWRYIPVRHFAQYISDKPLIALELLQGKAAQHYDFHHDQ